MKGIAVTGLMGLDQGRWEWSTNGKSWKPVAPVSEAMALLLRDSDHLHFVPNLNAVGGGTLTLRAWDQTRGTAGVGRI